MPPQNFLLPKFPAEIDNSAIPQVGEIAEPEIDVFDEHP
jgi:hypothetical protein